ncbi:MAG: hypothetical protein QG597_957 [Actinomycetota bacterium]|nr:hypothetical protein [Actinomycetota bacterium]
MPGVNTAAAPGWYPDPQHHGTQRYWNGESWTAQTAPLAPPQATPPPQVVVNVAQTAGHQHGHGARYVSGLTTGQHIFHGTLTVFTGGLWGVVWWSKARFGRRRIS